MTKIKAEYIDHMGTDLTVVNAARVSFDKLSQWLPAGTANDYDGAVHQVIDGKPVILPRRDVKLIEYLARGMSSGEWEQIIQEIADTNDRKVVLSCLDRLDADTHWTPFGHSAITLRYSVPIFVARQEFKHGVGSVRNEVSRRYVDSEPEFFVPDAWRKRAENVKQGSSNEAVTNLSGNRYFSTPEDIYHTACIQAKVTYDILLRNGVAPEQARMVLPQSMMTTYWITGSLFFFANFYKKRINAHAQQEIQELARQVGAILEPLYPVSWKALTANLAAEVDDTAQAYAA